MTIRRMSFLRHGLPAIALLAAGFAPAAHATVIAGWDFTDEDLVADEGTPENAAATITTNGNAGFAGTVGAASRAANFSGMNTLLVSEIVVPVTTTGFAELSLSFTTRTSGTASKYWLLQVDAGGGYQDLTPLIEHDGSTTTIPHTYSLDAFVDVIAVRILASDSIGDGTGDFIQADSVGVPASGGTFRLDDVSIEGTELLADGGLPPDPVDAGVDGGVDGGVDAGQPVDAGPPEVDAGPPPDVLVVSELFFNVLSGSDLGKEWIELLNVSDVDVPLDGVTIESTRNQTPVVEYSHLVAGTGLVLAPGDRVIIAQQGDLGLGVCPPGDVVVVDDAVLQYKQAAATQGVRVFAPAQGAADAFDFELTYRGGDAPDTATTNGASLVRSDVDGTTSAEATCVYGTDSLGSPGLASAGCTTAAFACPDGGAPSPDPTPEDAGPIVEPDPLPENEPPTITMDNIVGSGTSITLRWSASDPEDGDAVEVALFYDVDDSGFDGVLIERGLQGGTTQSYAWDLSTTPPGNYRVFGRVTDTRGETAYAYSSGAVQVGDRPGEVATLVVVEPDGVNDLRDDGAVIISWEAVLPPNATGTVSIFYDTDDAGFDGIPIAAGLSPAGEGATLLWEPVDVAPGNYAIYAVLDWSGGEVSAYGAFVTLGGPTCGCTQVRQGSGVLGPNGRPAALNPVTLVVDLLCAALIAILVLLLGARPRRRRAHEKTAQDSAQSCA